MGEDAGSNQSRSSQPELLTGEKDSGGTEICKRRVAFGSRPIDSECGNGVSYDEFENTVIGRYVKKVKPQAAIYYCTVRNGKEQNSNLFQLADLLVGLVGFVWNGDRDRKSQRATTRQELVKWIESELKIKIGRKTTYSAKKFNIWVFEAA